VLACHHLDVAVAGRMLVAGLTASFEPGQVIALLGRNGAGKTLTLHTLAGLRPPAGGRVTLGDRSLEAWPRRARACQLSLLPQAVEDPFPTSVLETVLIGRHPHLDFWQWEGRQDLALARDCLARVDLDGCESRDVDTLSGGERRRLAVAALLAQDPAVCLLDEPTNHLDPPHQLAILELFRRRADAGGTVLASLHDATLAARFADCVLLLHGDGEWRFGPCQEVLRPAELTRLYGSPIEQLDHHGRRIFFAA
jgi:iron complex transport system ATP-binding protein